MNRQHTFPPNYNEIITRFPIVSKRKNIIFTYGETIYTPYLKEELPQDLIIHEQTHSLQQGDAPENWWKQYLSDTAFRKTQETEAYRKQYQYATENYNRDLRRRLLKHIITDLRSKIYDLKLTTTEIKLLLLQDE